MGFRLMARSQFGKFEVSDFYQSAYNRGIYLRNCKQRRHNRWSYYKKTPLDGTDGAQFGASLVPNK
ncbi:MAG: hypothetical protein SGJ18_05765 [Pseudomonadota bacterium]|nr:hypothetical protein [Pseudomonadota bacterium]